MIKFICSFCGQKIETTENNIGKDVNCPSCSNILVVPSSSQLPPTQTSSFIPGVPWYKRGWRWVKSHKRFSIPAFLLISATIVWVMIHVFGNSLAIILAGLAAIVPGLAIIFLFLCLYFLPYFIAKNRNNKQQEAILVANLLFGWTLVGWGICLVWAHIE